MFLSNPTKKIFLELEYLDYFMWLLILLGDLLWETGSHDYGGWEAAQSAICELNYSGIIQSKSKSLRAIWANGANISVRSRKDDMSYLSSNSEARKKKQKCFFSNFCSVKALIGLMSTHSREDNLFLLNSLIEMLISPINTFSDTPRNNV